MVNKDGIRELAYVVRVSEVKPIEGKDRVECAMVGGWSVMVHRGDFHPGSLGVYFEIDSRLPELPEYEFLASKNYKIKIQKYKTPSGYFFSEGLLMSPADLGWLVCTNKDGVECLYNGETNSYYAEGDFLTSALGVTYADPADNVRKGGDTVDKYKKMAQRMGKKFSKQPYRWLMQRAWGKKLLYFFFGRTKKDISKEWPVGKFSGVTKTDQERIENIPSILSDKTPYIVTQKCDGSSGTYILERKPRNKFEFYVCSRNVRMKDESQECFYGTDNYYWEVAKRYNIEAKMKDWLIAHPEATFICWQGEICAPGIQGNPHGLTETHFYCFHWTDSLAGRLDIRIAEQKWKELGMEVVPIVDTNYILPDEMEDLKLTADGYYDASVCEGKTSQKREGFVYYKTSDPTFSFKNVSREYLLKH